MEGTEKTAKKDLPKEKVVRNRSGHRVELLIDGKIVVFFPGMTKKVPADFNVPSGLGLQVK